MAKNGFKNGRPRGRRSGPARIISKGLWKKVRSLYKLPIFLVGGSSLSGPITCDSTLITCDSTLITCDQTEA